MHVIRVSLMGCFIATLSATASAQDARRVGLTTGYPGVIGILWHASERIAIRPEFSFTKNDSSSESTFANAASDFWSFGTGVSLLFFAPLRDNLKTYVSPRFAYTRTSGGSDTTDSTVDAYSVSGALGGHYSLGQRFALFGELGISYSHQTGSITSSLAPTFQTTNRGDSISTRTAVGIVLYF